MKLILRRNIFIFLILTSGFYGTLFAQTPCTAIPTPQFAQANSASTVMNGVTVTRVFSRPLYSLKSNNSASTPQCTTSLAAGYSWLRAEDSNKSETITYTFSQPQTSVQVFLLLMGNAGQSKSADMADFSVNNGGNAFSIAKNPTAIDCLGAVTISGPTRNTVRVQVLDLANNTTNAAVLVSSTVPFTTLTITNPRSNILNNITDGYGYYVELCPTSIKCTAPATPTVSTQPATCSAAGTATITNYSATNTYTFAPNGPSVGAGGVISNLTAGTNYTVNAKSGTGTCASANSTSFTVQAKLATPTISGNLTAPTGSTSQLTGSGTKATTNPWVSSNTSIATVNEDGLVTGVSPGTSTIKYTNNVGCSTQVIFTVQNDWDGDGVPDNLDLDDDNDGVLDTEELHCDQTIPPNGAFPTASTDTPTTGVTGAFAKQLLFFNWNGKTLANGTTQTVTHNGIDYTATISAVTTPLNMAPSRILTWPAGPTHMVGKYYQFADPNFKPVFYNSAPVGSNNQNRITSFNVTISAKKDTKEYPVDVVVFDSEVTTSTRNEKIIFDVINNGSAFELLEQFGSDPITNNITLSNSNKTLTYSNTEAAKVNAMYVTRGYSPTIKATSTSAKDNNGGQQGVGFAVRLYCDTDKDGVFNYLDFDSDGDGCADSNEYYNTTALPWSPASVTVDANGKVVGAAYSGGSYANAVVATNANISKQPINRTINAGANTTFTVGATSFNTSTFTAGVPNYTSPPATDNAANIKYQWQVSTNGGTTWTNLTNVAPYSGVLTNILTITAAPLSLNNNRYRAVVNLTNNICTLLPSNGAILTVKEVVCYNDANTTSAGVDTKHGITLLKRAGVTQNNWPMVRKGAHTALESNTKGFVITRIATADLAGITTPVDGMMVYDTTVNCLKIYTVDENTPSNTGWKCFSTPACP